MSEMGYGISREGVMGMAYTIVEKSKRFHPFREEVQAGPGLKASRDATQS